MRAGFIAGLVVLGVCVTGFAAQPSGFHLSGAAGIACCGSAEAIHLAAGLEYSVKPFLSLGADAAYSYLPLSPIARGGGNRSYWGLLTLSAAARPKAKVSPYLVVGYGVGRYESSLEGVEHGDAMAFGAGLRVRLGARASLLVESRLAWLGGILASNGLHLELPVKVGVRFGL